MKGIIVKPSVCCGNTTNIGRVVTFLEKTPQDQDIVCPWCSELSRNKGEFVRVVPRVQGQRISVLESRIKWFNDDLDKEIEMESNEDIVKEKEHFKCKV